MKKIYYVTTILIILIVSFIGITYSIEYQDEGVVSFELIGPSPLYINVGSKYEEYGVKATLNNADISDQIKIDDTKIDVHVLGEYKVKYEYKGEYIYRDIVVFDKEKPVINLTGGDEIYILLNGSYHENGWSVTDNYDEELNDKVKVEGKVDTNKEGEYILKYTVTDSSGNKGEKERRVIVKKSVVSVSLDGANRVYSPSSYNVYLYSNTVVKNYFYKYGIHYDGYTKDVSGYYKIKLKNTKNKLEYTYNMTTSKANYYSGNLNLTTLENGIYDVYIIGSKEEKLMNKLDFFSRIVRSKVGNKLITFTYDNDYVKMTVEDFNYQYDVVIDPGHGGSDTGTANGLMIEKDLNLKISKYEKCRYEAMGYKVYMTRYNDTYGEMLGNKYLDQLDRRALTIGYYGAVSRVTYSNHHNGSYDSLESGFEIIVPSTLNASELAPEISLYNQYMTLYKLKEDKIRMYGKDNDKDYIFDKSKGQVYSNRNFYSVIRIPYELFNVKNVIYEPIFMTNPNDFNWYYANNNWIKISEMKIQEYVKYMGGVYNEDNKKCL